MADFVRPAIAAMRSEGQHACVIGPNDEVLVEVCHGSPDEQLQLAARIAEMMRSGPEDIDHCCSSEGKKWRAKLALQLINRNGIRDVDAMEFIAATAEDAGGTFCRAMVSNPDEVPF